MIKLNVHEQFRILFPGAIVVLLLVWYQGGQLSPNIIAGFFIGLLIYPFYRGTMWPISRWIKSKIIGIPQLDFHNKIIEEFNLPKDNKGILNASTCAYHVLLSAPPDFRAELALQNSYAHILKMSSLIALFVMIFFLVNDLKGALLWLAVAIIIYIAGLVTDHLADKRESSYLKKNRDKYIDEIRSL